MNALKLSSQCNHSKLRIASSLWTTKEERSIFCPLQLVIFHQLNTVDKELYLIVVIFFVFIYSVS